jgi:hypothetical protein
VKNYYKTKTFEAKKKKAKLHEDVVDEVLSHGDRGCVVSLPGPAIERHVKVFQPLLRKNSQCMLVEWNRDMVREEQMRQRMKACGDLRFVLSVGNVWDCLRRCYINRQGWEYKHVLFDLDFCATVDILVSQGLILELKRLARSKLPRRTGFWISLTVCKRQDIDREWAQLPGKIVDIFENVGWRNKHWSCFHYKEQKGARMFHILLRFEYDRNLTRKKIRQI